MPPEILPCYSGNADRTVRSPKVFEPSGPNNSIVIRTCSILSSYVFTCTFLYRVCHVLTLNVFKSRNRFAKFSLFNFGLSEAVNEDSVYFSIA